MGRPILAASRLSSRLRRAGERVCTAGLPASEAIVPKLTRYLILVWVRIVSPGDARGLVANVVVRTRSEILKEVTLPASVIWSRFSEFGHLEVTKKPFPSAAHSLKLPHPGSITALCQSLSDKLRTSIRSEWLESAMATRKPYGRFCGGRIRGNQRRDFRHRELSVCGSDGHRGHQIIRGPIRARRNGQIGDGESWPARPDRCPAVLRRPIPPRSTRPR